MSFLDQDPRFQWDRIALI